MDNATKPAQLVPGKTYDIQHKRKGRLMVFVTEFTPLKDREGVCDGIDADTQESVTFMYDLVASAVEMGVSDAAQ